eukprot:1158639-Pelagomonas_calceolata.AAC.8
MLCMPVNVQDWIDVGKAASRCLCKKDCVRISMTLFDPDWNSDSEDESEVGAPVLPCKPTFFHCGRAVILIFCALVFLDT